MKRLWQTLFQQLTSTLRERMHLALMTMALRHQLAVLGFVKLLTLLLTRDIITPVLISQRPTEPLDR
jgi:hypothetical protein